MLQNPKSHIYNDCTYICFVIFDSMSANVRHRQIMLKDPEVPEKSFLQPCLVLLLIRKSSHFSVTFPQYGYRTKVSPSTILVIG